MCSNVRYFFNVNSSYTVLTPQICALDTVAVVYFIINLLQTKMQSSIFLMPLFFVRLECVAKSYIHQVDLTLDIDSKHLSVHFTSLYTGFTDGII